jgi:RNA polymerase sigma-70 factor (ECF subfamily)
MRAAAIESLDARMRAAVAITSPGRREVRVRSWNEAEAGTLAEGMRPEADLIDAASGGDAKAFEEIVRRHMRRAFSVAYRVLGQRQDAEDAVQDAFLAALVKLETFDRSRPFSPWLLRIVANRSINLRKARALRQTEPMPAEARSPAASPHESAERSELREELRRALAQLPEQQRWIVELFELDGFTGPEIAEMLEMSEGTVRWHLHQARRTLRAVLDRSAMRTA